MQSMTKRDRTLLTVVLPALAVFLIGYYLIYPTIRKNTALRADIAAAESGWEALENKVMQLPALRKTYDSRLEEYQAAAAFFYPPMESQEIDRMLTEMVLEREMFCDTLHITLAPQPLELTPYSHSELNNGGKYPALAGICCANLQLRVRGSGEQCRRLLDDMILMNPAIRLTNYQWDHDEDGAESGSCDVLRMTMELYMCQAGG